MAAAGIVILEWNYAQSAHALQLMSPSDFLSRVVDAVLSHFARQSLQVLVEWLPEGMSKGTRS